MATEQAVLHRVAQNACEPLFVDLVSRQDAKTSAARNSVGSNVLIGRFVLIPTTSSACSARRRTRQRQIRTPCGYARRCGSRRAPSCPVSSVEPLVGQLGLTATAHNAFTKQLLAAQTSSAFAQLLLEVISADSGSRHAPSRASNSVDPLAGLSCTQIPALRPRLAKAKPPPDSAHRRVTVVTVKSLVPHF